MRQAFWEWKACSDGGGIDGGGSGVAGVLANAVLAWGGERREGHDRMAERALSACLHELPA